MPFDMMDFALARRVSKLTSKHTTNATPLHEAWSDIVKAARPGIGPAVAKAALTLPIAEGLVTIAAEFAALLARDNAGPAKKVNGLWFGLAEFARDGDFENTFWMPYIAGSTRFSPKKADWAVDPGWFPEDRWAPNEPMMLLSLLRLKHEARSWYIETCLLEPLHRLYVVHFARGCPSPILLGKSKSRGIGCGFDEGDLLTIGVSDHDGFKPIKQRG